MSKFRCTCGFVMLFQSGEEPYDQELTLKATMYDAWDALREQLEAGERDYWKLKELFFDLCGKGKTSVLNCPACERIWMGVESLKTDGTDIECSYHSYVLEKFTTTGLPIPPPLVKPSSASVALSTEDTPPSIGNTTDF
jgi:hypothetical protein